MISDTYPDQTTKDFQLELNLSPKDTNTNWADYNVPESLVIDVGNLSEGWYDSAMYPTFSFDIDVGRPDYKFNEGDLLREFEEYVKGTYTTHYSEEKFQATEFIIDGGHGTGFCIGNILKYAQRYGKKGTYKDARKDLLKVMHYALIQLYVHDLESVSASLPNDVTNSHNHTADYEDAD